MSVYKKDSRTYLREAVESVLQQSESGFDFLIMRDGPLHPDVEAYLDSLGDERIRFFRNQENLGLARSLNIMLKSIGTAQYKYIARMDADDISRPDRFRKQTAWLDAHPETDGLGTWAVEFEDKERVFFRKKMPVSHADCFRFFRKRDWAVHPTLMFRGRFFDKAGLYPEDTYFAEDTMLWAHAFKAGCKVANLPEYLYHFRLDPKFFQRRRGTTASLSILRYRTRIIKMLDYPWYSYLYAFAYFLVRVQPPFILRIAYKLFR